MINLRKFKLHHSLCLRCSRYNASSLNWRIDLQAVVMLATVTIGSAGTRPLTSDATGVPDSHAYAHSGWCMQDGDFM